jgi:germination protein YpeB
LAESTVKGNDLSDDDLDNLEMLYKYAVSLKDILNEMEIELNSGMISWNDLSKKIDLGNTDELNVFANIESNFDDYEGLIYDGAYSDYVEKSEKLGLVGDEITEDEAKEKINSIFGKDNIESIEYKNELTSGDIDSYSFDIKANDIDMNVLIAKKGRMAC